MLLYIFELIPYFLLHIIVMVPTTKGSELAKRIREVVTRIPGPKGTSIKVVECPGEPILRDLAPNNPFRMESCMRDRCPFMESDRKCSGKCYRESIVYSAECLQCDSIKAFYVGESSRTLYTRKNQHSNDLKKAIKDSEAGILDPHSSWILDHIRSSHPTVSWKESDSMFQFALLSSHRDPLTRQTYEAVRIQQAFETGTITVRESERWITHNQER